MKIFSNTPVVFLRGSPREQGVQYGELCRESIASNLESLKGEHQEIFKKGVSPELYHAAVRRNREFVQRVSPETIEEIEGIAEGSSCELEALIDLNLMAYFALRRLPAECSQLLAESIGGPTRKYLAKTRDVGSPRMLQTVLHRTYDDRLQIAEVIHAGAITSPGSGINSYGLAVSTSGVWGADARYPASRANEGWNLVNPHVWLRDCRTVNDLEAAVNVTDRLTAMNVVAADSEASASFEVTPGSVIRTSSAGQGLALTNHCASPSLQGFSPSKDEYRSTYDRLDTLRSALASEAHWTLDDVLNTVRSHDGYPQSSICRHALSDEDSLTIYASVAVLPELEFYVMVGNPCEVPTDDLVQYEMKGN